MLFDGNDKISKADAVNNDGEKSVFADGQPFFMFGVRDMAKEMYTANIQRNELHESGSRVMASILTSRDNDAGLEAYAHL